MPRALFAALMLLVPLPIWAKDTPMPAGPVRQLVLAHDLYDLALERDDAGLVLAAIALAHAADLRPATGWVHEGAGTPAEPAPSGPGLPHDPRSPEALALAEMMAEGTPDMADLAADMSVPAVRAQGFLSTMAMSLPAAGADSWRIAFNGQLPAEIAVLGDAAAFDLLVQDDTGATVCRDMATRRAYCGFTPKRNSFYIITVTNAGQAGAGYSLLTN